MKCRPFCYTSSLCPRSAHPGRPAQSDYKKWKIGLGAMDDTMPKQTSGQKNDQTTNSPCIMQRCHQEAHIRRPMNGMVQWSPPWPQWGFRDVIGSWEPWDLLGFPCNSFSTHWKCPLPSTAGLQTLHRISHMVQFALKMQLLYVVCVGFPTSFDQFLVFGFN